MLFSLSIKCKSLCGGSFFMQATISTCLPTRDERTVETVWQLGEWVEEVEPVIQWMVQCHRPTLSLSPPQFCE